MPAAMFSGVLFSAALSVMYSVLESGVQAAALPTPPKAADNPPVGVYRVEYLAQLVVDKQLLIVRRDGQHHARRAGDPAW